MKGLDRIAAVGRRLHGNRVRAGRAQKLGNGFLFVAIDDATRVAYAVQHPARDGVTCARFLADAVAWFAQPGMPVRGVMTGNSKAYLGRGVQRVLATHAIPHVRTRSYRPQNNGKAEHFIQTDLRRWAFKRPYRIAARRLPPVPRGRQLRPTTPRHRSHPVAAPNAHAVCPSKMGATASAKSIRSFGQPTVDPASHAPT